MTDPHDADSPAAAQVAVVTCRRCGQAYGLPPHRRFVLAACPHCGAAHRRPWRMALRDNRNAAVLALLALPVLSVAILTPFMSMSQLGQVRTYSLVGGIAELWRRGYVFIAALLVLFSVLFPYAKLLGILIATSRWSGLSHSARRRLHGLAVATGKYSLLDVLVVAIVIVVVRFDAIAEAEARVGTYLFCAAVFLSMAAGYCAKLDGEETAP